ncbi:hypothetical protein B0H16DRAFT_383201 [Mycena metata]|uniref:Uncharacterized protein n=1 Tax=Mycena metata TaxID=1033252 RepID=A0AAD7HH16_9AGAR|nr:hypothetical protein B0H16DRAFT_383201 [Mycena metata]
MAPPWPLKLSSSEAVLKYLDHVSTPSIANSDFLVDFIPPAGDSSTVYTDIDGDTYNFWVFGRVTEAVTAVDGHLVFKLGAGRSIMSKEFFQRQLNTLAKPVRHDDDLDTDFNRNMQAEPCTDVSRVHLTGGTFISIRATRSLGKRAFVYSGSGTTDLLQVEPWYPVDFPFANGDWVLVYASLHKDEDATTSKRTYAIIASDIRVMSYAPELVTAGVDGTEAGDAEMEDTEGARGHLPDSASSSDGNNSGSPTLSDVSQDQEVVEAVHTPPTRRSARRAAALKDKSGP